MSFCQSVMLVLATAVIAASSTPSFALGDGPAIASDWADLTISQSECFARGEAAIEGIEFGDVERTKYSRFASRDGYTVSVRCIEEKRMVLFLASGRDRTIANKLQLNLQRHYSKGP